MSTDLPSRLRVCSKYALMDAARSTVLEAADEIERLRNGALSGRESVLLTDAEREAIHGAIDAEHSRGAWKWAETLRGLLERLGG